MRFATYFLLTALAVCRPAVPAELRTDATQDMFRAIRFADASALQAALDQGISPNATQADGTTALMYAVLYSDLNCTRILLEKGADVNRRNEAGATSLMWSVHDPAKVRLLLDRGAQVNVASKEKRTALLIAARQDGAAEVVSMLLAAGADPNAVDSMGGTALMLAADAGDVEVMGMLVKRGAKIDQRASAGFGSPRFGNPSPEVMEKIKMRMGMAGKDGPPPGPTALMVAAHAGNKECMRFLLEHAADPNVNSPGSFDVLGLTAQARDPEMVKMLLDKGARVDQRDFRGATPLILAAASDEVTPETIRLLISKGSNVRAKDENGQTALAWALKRGDTAVVKALRDAGAEE